MKERSILTKNNSGYWVCPLTNLHFRNTYWRSIVHIRIINWPYIFTYQSSISTAIFQCCAWNEL